MSNKRILAGAMLAAAFGCGGDEGGGTTDDPRTLPEGGGFRVEFMEIGKVQAEILGEGVDGDRIFYNDTELIFYTDQTPAVRGWPPKIRDIGRELEDGTVCYNTKEILSYWVSTITEQQAVVDTRSYLDMGETVTLVGENGYELDLIGEDGGLSPLQGLAHGKIYLPDDLTPNDPIPSGWFEVVPQDMPDSFPDFAPTNGITMWTGNPVERFGAFRPPPFDLEYPLESPYMEFGVAYRTDQDFTWRADVPPMPDDANEWGKTLGVIRITDTGIVIETICFNAEQHGTLTVPKEIIAEFPEGGIAAFNFMSANVYEWDGRQFDATGFTCKNNLFCTDDPNETDGVCSPGAIELQRKKLEKLGIRLERVRVPNVLSSNPY